MTNIFRSLFFLSLLAWVTGCVTANEAEFKEGPAITDFGPIASIVNDSKLSNQTKFKVAFDMTEEADIDEMNRTLSSAARFINMHVDAGVPLENIEVAIVVHGYATIDFTNNDFYRRKNGGQLNDTADEIAVLQQNNVEFLMCGQSAAARGITKDNLLPGVKMELSAMTAHALLQQNGYTLNPY